VVKAGVLVHVYHLEAAGWENLVWGEPAKGLMGTLPKLVQLLLIENPDEPIDKIIMYTGPSSRDGLDESHYGKKFLLDHFDQLKEFPQLAPILQQLSGKQQQAIYDKLEAIVNGPQLINSADEVINAAAFFKEHGITKVYQLAIASHVPRCIQVQTVARYQHQIPAEQFWYTVAAETTYKDTVPSDVVIAEPPHRADDPALGVHPSITDVIKQYYKLPYTQRQPFIKGVEGILESLPPEA
jgi:hypothetical protein